MNVYEHVPSGLEDGYVRRKNMIIHISKIEQITSLLETAIVPTSSKSAHLLVWRGQELKTAVKYLEQI
jgi:hypothetical protein